MTFWTPEREQQARDLMADGKSAAEVGAIIGTTRNAVLGRMFRSRHGGKSCINTGHARKIPVERHADIYAAWKNGVFQRTLAARYGVGVQTIQRICKVCSEAAQ